MGRIIAIDYGSKRSGIAVSDPGKMLASPLDTVPTHDLMSFLESYFKNEEVELLVVGYPRKMDHSDSDSMKLIRFFVQAFKKRFASVPVKWVDERFTSSLAADALYRGGMKKKDRRIKGQLDKVSAALILQTYLEQQNNPRS